MSHFLKIYILLILILKKVTNYHAVVRIVITTI
nr:MAG TPA: hypothetical protein [Caudoviricetes sp.]